MAFRTLQFFLRELSNSIQRNTLMMVASVTTMTLLIFLFGFFSLFLMNFEKLGKALSEQVEIHAYLNKGVTESDSFSLRNRIRSIPNVSSVKYVSSEEAMEELKADTKQEINLSGILSNPLPPYLIVKVNDPDEISAVAQAIQKMPLVQQVNDLQKVIKSFTALFKTISRLFLGLVFLLLFCAIAIIYNTIRLGVFSRRKEIEIMQLVGASYGLVSWPFILEGAFYGLLGSLFAILFLVPGYSALASKISEVFSIFPLVERQDVALLLLSLSGIGILVGSFGSFLSVHRYLHY